MFQLNAVVYNQPDRGVSLTYIYSYGMYAMLLSHYLVHSSSRSNENTEMGLDVEDYKLLVSVIFMHYSIYVAISVEYKVVRYSLYTTQEGQKL